MKQANKENWLRRIRQRGAAVTEMVVVLPALLLVGLGAIQWALVYEAKSTLNHAAMMAARAGAVDHASPTSMKLALARGLVPLYSPDKGATLLDTDAYLRAGLDVFGPFTRVKIINPTSEAFADFGMDETGQGENEIPNLRLHLKDTVPGRASGINVQDANILKIQILHGHKLKVPFVGPILAQAAAMTTTDPDRLLMLADNRLPMLTTATVRMQSAARESNLLANVEEIDLALKNSLIDNPPGGGDAGDGGGDTGGGDSDPGGSDPGDGNQPPDPLECEKTTLEEDDGGAENEDQGFWGDLWDGITGGLKFGYEFAKGFWQGIKNQVGDLIDLILNPIETAKGLAALAKAFFDDFEGTARMIAEAIGADFSTLINCGAYDKGRIIGEYVNPAFMLKLATRLAKFGKLAKALERTKRDFGCASFAAGTPVWTPDGRVRIEALMRGDFVHSRHEMTYADVPNAITSTFNRTAPDYYRLVTERETLEVTGEHPLWVQGKGWTEVEDIEANEVLAAADGDVLVIHNEKVDSEVQVYNFSVAETPSYFAGDAKIWSHNAPCDAIFLKSGKNAELNSPKPNARYYVDGQHIFVTDDLGRTTKVQSTITPDTLDKNLRDCYRTGKVGRCGLPDDDGGHLVANQLGGPGEEINLVPMNSNLNRGLWKRMENDWARRAANGETIEVQIEVIYDGNTNRPLEFIVTEIVDGVEQTPRIFKNQPGG